MYKLSIDINKLVLFNEFTKKISTFRTYHVIEAKKRYRLFSLGSAHTWKLLCLVVDTNSSSSQVGSGTEQKNTTNTSPFLPWIS
jgi:hypothetical protein